LRGEYGLRVFGSMVLRITFGNKREEVTGEFRKLHKEEFCKKTHRRNWYVTNMRITFILNVHKYDQCFKEFNKKLLMTAIVS
jgi:hypothetical protein